MVVVDLSNLCRDDRLLAEGESADLASLDRFVEALEHSPIAFSRVISIADHSLRYLFQPGGKKRLQELADAGEVEFSAVADERILELAFGTTSDPPALVASLDSFDDFRPMYPEIQGSTDRFIGWDVSSEGFLEVFWRDMAVHTHRRLSRKEEQADLKARRLRRQSIIQRAAERYYRCESHSCLLAQLWPDRLPELPRFDDQSDCLVCPGCRAPVTAAGPRPVS
ncbi:MAG: hypothetical protein AAGK32_19420, partial [Actinomycetota bacterium]